MKTYRVELVTPDPYLTKFNVVISDDMFTNVKNKVVNKYYDIVRKKMESEEVLEDNMENILNRMNIKEI